MKHPLARSHLNIEIIRLENEERPFFVSPKIIYQRAKSSLYKDLLFLE